MLLILPDNQGTKGTNHILHNVSAFALYIYIYINMYIYIYIYIYLVNILTRIFKECSIQGSRAYIFIYLSKIKTQRFLRYTVFHVFPQSSDVIIFYTVCFFNKYNLS